MTEKDRLRVGIYNPETKQINYENLLFHIKELAKKWAEFFSDAPEAVTKLNSQTAQEILSSAVQNPNKETVKLIFDEDKKIIFSAYYMFLGFIQNSEWGRLGGLYSKAEHGRVVWLSFIDWLGDKNQNICIISKITQENTALINLMRQFGFEFYNYTEAIDKYSDQVTLYIKKGFKSKDYYENDPNILFAIREKDPVFEYFTVEQLEKICSLKDFNHYLSQIRAPDYLKKLPNNAKKRLLAGLPPLLKNLVKITIDLGFLQGKHIPWIEYGKKSINANRNITWKDAYDFLQITNSLFMEEVIGKDIGFWLKENYNYKINMLDVASGPGHVAQAINSKHPINVTCADINSHMLNNAKNHFPEAKTLQIDFNDPNQINKLPDNHYNCLFIYGTEKGIKPESINLLYKKLTTNGILIFPYATTEKYVESKNWEGKFPKNIFSHLKNIQKSGFEILDLPHYINGSFFPLRVYNVIARKKTENELNTGNKQSKKQIFKMLIRSILNTKIVKESQKVNNHYNEANIQKILEILRLNSPDIQCADTYLFDLAA